MQSISIQREEALRLISLARSQLSKDEQDKLAAAYLDLASDVIIDAQKSGDEVTPMVPARDRD